jgi:hypothetical protein
MANTKPPTRAVTSLSSWLLIFFYSFQKGKSVFTIVIITRQTHTHIHTIWGISLSPRRAERMDNGNQVEEEIPFWFAYIV